MNWQPIETAPRDGTKILLAHSDVIDVGFWHVREQFRYEPYDRDGHDLYRRIADAPYELWDWNGPGCPTHWMPIPDPPGPDE